MKNKKLNRRDFLTKSTLLGLGGYAALSLGGVQKVFSQNGGSEIMQGVDMVAVKGGQPGIMFKKAIEAWGGMKKIVSPGQTVVVKPNIGWNVTPDRAANTNPELVREIVRECLRVGAKEVFVMDHTADVWTKCYKNSGIEQATKDAGGKIVPGNNERDFKKVSIPGAKRLTETKIHDLILNSDVLINVPVLKHHVSTKLSLGMKNLMGIVWDRQWWHKNDLHQCIADLYKYLKPDLTIVDAYKVMKRNGPMGVTVEDVVLQKALLLGTDPVAIDAAAARMFGMVPDEVGYIRIAESMGLGSTDLASMNIQKIKL
jgi:uncharacterized protein (DUF362 family)